MIQFLKIYMQHASESSVVHLIALFVRTVRGIPSSKKQTAKSTKSCLLYVHSVNAYYCSWWQVWWFHVLALHMKWIEIIHILSVFLAKLVTDPFPKRSLLGLPRIYRATNLNHQLTFPALSLAWNLVVPCPSLTTTPLLGSTNRMYVNV